MITADGVGQAEQQLDQLAGADHLRDQVEGDDGQRAAGGERADRGLLQPVGGDVGEGVLAEIAQALGDHEQDDRPADQKADRVDQAVIAGRVDQRRDAEEGGRRHVVAGDREAVLEAGDAAAGGVEVGRRLGPLGGPVGDGERRRDEDEKHDDRRDVERLTLDLAGHGVGRDREIRREDRERQGARGRREGCGPGHHFEPSTICWLSASNSAFARRT